MLLHGFGGCIQNWYPFIDDQDLASIRARTLVVHGERDNFFPVEIPERMSRAIPDAKLWVIPGGDHVPIFDPAVPFTSTALHFLVGVSAS